MKRFSIILCIILLTGMFSACASGEGLDTIVDVIEPAIIETQPAPESESEPESKPEQEPEAVENNERDTESDSTVEHVATSETAIDTSAGAVYTFIIVDTEGNPVANIKAALSFAFRHYDEDGNYSVTFDDEDWDDMGWMQGTSGVFCTDTDGKLYFTDRQRIEGLTFDDVRICMYPMYYDGFGDCANVDVSDPTKEISVVWKHEIPPNQAD